MQEHSNYWLRRRVSRRTALRGSALTVAGASTMALVGCGDDDDDSGGGNTNGGGQVLLPTAAASPTTAKQPKPGGSFAFQMPNIPTNLDPYTQTSFQAAYVHGLGFSKLYRFKAGTPEFAPADNSMEPDLAAAMPEQADQLTYTIKLKPGIKFHNGRALTSEDIRYAYDRYMNYEKSVHKTGLGFIDKMETPDAQTFKFTTKVPYADTVNYLGGNLGAWISPKEHAEGPDAATKMVGSGPFMLTETQTGVSMTFKKYADYHDKRYPYFDEVKAFGYSAVASRQDCLDLVAGHYSVYGREVQVLGVGTKTCHASASLRQLACDVYDTGDLRGTIARGAKPDARSIPSQLRGMIECHAENASYRSDETKSSDKGVQDFLVNRCVQDVLPKWLQERDVVLGEVSMITDAIANVSLAASFDPEQAIIRDPAKGTTVTVAGLLVVLPPGPMTVTV